MYYNGALLAGRKGGGKGDHWGGGQVFISP